MRKKDKILVAMSGGVDSSVAAALLVEQGYDVTGMFAINYDGGIQPAGHSEATPCWRPDYQDALRVCAHLGIPLLRWNFVNEYKKYVLDYMYKEYSRGRTPNPDILCNKFVKFGVWLDKAKKMGFDKIATGHYARLSHIPNPISRRNEISKRVTGYGLWEAQDSNKDQTYFLHQLSQKQLQHVMFPIGEYTKPEVRKLAKKFKLPTAKKEESMGICFVGEVNMKDFLKNKIIAKPGDVVLSSGEVVGKHDGLGYYTIGQRHIGGIRDTGYVIRDRKPLFVVDKNIKKNLLILGYKDDPLLNKKEVSVDEVSWIGQAPKFPVKCEVRLRHRQPLQSCILNRFPLTGGCKGVFAQFDKPQRAVTPGQFAVFYLKGECLGGGVIM